MKKNKNSLSHTPVLINEAINFLCVNKNCLYVDATFGDGGHSKAILEKNKTCKVFAIDRDPDVLERGKFFEKKYKENINRVKWAASNNVFLIYNRMIEKK